ncbi:MAG TPA: D-glycero-beta-D-manno-heptose-7-phosphate kinase [Armatimonadota bacterium]
MYSQYLDACAQQRVLIIGDIILDEYIFGEVRRISPEAPIPVVVTRRREYRAGGAGNVALNIAALGGTPLLCGVVGADVPATQLADMLGKQLTPGTAYLITSPDRPTTLKSRILAQNQQMVRLDTEETAPVPASVEEELLAVVRAQLQSVQAVVLSDYAKGVLSDRVCREVITLGAAHGLPVIVDPKGVGYARYAGCTLITPNRYEACVATNQSIHSPADLDAVAAALLALLAGGSLLLTRGEEGMSLYRPQQAPMHIAAKARTVYDVTGAGDTVVANLALALATRLPMEAAVALANYAASIVVGKLGATPVTRDEMRELLAQVRASAGETLSAPC